MSFTPKFADLVKSTTTVQGTAAVVPGAAVTGFRGFPEACQPGDQFYYCIQGTDKPAETEVGRGTLLANGTIERSVPSGTLTKFTGGNKTIAMVAAAEWFAGAGAASQANGAPVASRAALAALADATDGMVRQVDEPRCGGLFRFVAADLSAKVTGDSAKAVYVAPSSAPSGASGAWVRQFDGTLLFDWFGAVPGDAATGAGADCLGAWNALQAFLAANPRNRTAGYQCAGPVVLFPGAQYNFSDTLLLSRQVHLKGFGSGQYNEATWLRFPADKGGILVKDSDFTGAGAIIEGFTLQGSGGTAAGTLAGELLKSGIRLVTRATVRDCFIRNFSGAGICVSAAVGGTGDYSGNANNWRIEDCTVEQNKSHGVYVSGGDANAGCAVAVNAQYNGRFGICDDSFLGNAWIGCHSASNGGGWCYDNGRIYYAAHGASDAQLQASAPASNPSWHDGGAYGAADAGHPQWSATLTVVAGGAYAGTSGYSTYFGCYYETGQAPPQPGGLVIGGFMGDGIVDNHLFGIDGGLASGRPITRLNRHVGGENTKVRLGGPSGNGYDELIGWNAPAATAGFNPDVFFGLAFERATGDLAAAGNWASGMTAIGTPGSSFRIRSGLGTLTYGRADAAATSGVVQVAELALGSGNGARVISMAAAPPGTGSHARGERLFNDGSATPLGSVDYWLCTASGTPGSWQAVSPGHRPVSTQAGSAFTPGLADQDSYIRFTSGIAVTLTLPADAAVAFPVGTEITIEQAGTGALTVAGAGGVSVNSRGGDLTLAGQYAVAVAKKVAADSWCVTGDL